MQTVIKFFIRDISLAEKYGFFKPDPSCPKYWWDTVRSAVAMAIVEKNRQIQIYSPNANCIACLCEMYKNGDLEIVEAVKEVQYIPLTPEEAELIRKRRRESKDE